MRLSRPRRHATLPARRAHAEPRPAGTPARTATPPADTPPAVPPVPEAAAEARTLAAERRLRTAGGPEDAATYVCRCGAVFPAAPTTSVSCPLCGTHQAW